MIIFYRLVFLFFFFSFLYLKKVEFIAFLIVLLFLIDFKKVLTRTKKVIISIFLFNLGVSIGYLIMAYFKHFNPLDYLIYINLKVFLLTYFVFWFFEKINIIQFVSFNRDLSYLLTMTLSQIFSYKKTFQDLRDAFSSRVVSIKDKEKDFIINTLKFFFKKAMYDSKERSLAMKSRGFFENEE